MPRSENEGWKQGVKGAGELNRARDGTSGCRAASSAAEAESSGCGYRPLRPKESEPARDVAARRYVQAVLERYLWLPGTPRVTSRHDRRCAQALFRQGVPLDVVHAALMIAVARRTFRQGEPLPQVRALHYFLPVVQDLQESPCDPGYLRYLEQKLRPLAAQKARPIDSLQPPPVRPARVVE